MKNGPIKMWAFLEEYFYFHFCHGGRRFSKITWEFFEPEQHFFLTKMHLQCPSVPAGIPKRLQRCVLSVSFQSSRPFGARKEPPLPKILRQKGIGEHFFGEIIRKKPKKGRLIFFPAEHFDKSTPGWRESWGLRVCGIDSAHWEVLGNALIFEIGPCGEFYWKQNSWGPCWNRHFWKKIKIKKHDRFYPY